MYSQKRITRLWTFFVFGCYVVFHKDRYAVQDPQFFRRLLPQISFIVSSGSLLQRLRVGLDDGTQFWALVIDFFDPGEISLLLISSVTIFASGELRSVSHLDEMHTGEMAQQQAPLEFGY